MPMTYTVHNWQELKDAIADNTATVNVADNVDIDLLDIYPTGIPTGETILDFACAVFNGNGIVIRNAYCLGIRTASLIKIENSTNTAFSGFNFVNFYLNLGNNTQIVQGAGSHNNKVIPYCTFKGVCFGSALQHKLFDGIYKFFDCVLNINFSKTSTIPVSLYNTTIYDSCWIRFNTDMRFGCGSGHQNFLNTYIEGKFEASADNSVPMDLGNSLNCIINATLDAKTYTGCLIKSWSNCNVCLVNSTKIIGDVTVDTSSSSHGIITLVTDTQLKDYNYLKDIFPVVPNLPQGGGT